MTGGPQWRRGAPTRRVWRPLSACGGSAATLAAWLTPVVGMWARPPGMLAGMGATQSVGWRLASGTRPGEALEAGPEGAPEARGSLGDDEGDAAGVEQDAAADAQHALAEAAQAPAGMGGEFHGAAPGVHQFVGQQVQQQDGLVAGGSVDAGGQRRQRVVAVAALGARRRGQRRREDVHQLAEVALRGAALPVVRQQVLGGHGGGTEAGQQPKVLE